MLPTNTIDTGSFSSRNTHLRGLGTFESLEKTSDSITWRLQEGHIDRIDRRCLGGLHPALVPSGRASINPSTVCHRAKNMQHGEIRRTTERNGEAVQWHTPRGRGGMPTEQKKVGRARRQAGRSVEKPFVLVQKRRGETSVNIVPWLWR